MCGVAAWECVCHSLTQCSMQAERPRQQARQQARAGMQQQVATWHAGQAQAWQEAKYALSFDRAGLDAEILQSGLLLPDAGKLGPRCTQHPAATGLAALLHELAPTD